MGHFTRGHLAASRHRACRRFAPRLQDVDTDSVRTLPRRPFQPFEPLVHHHRGRHVRPNVRTYRGRVLAQALRVRWLFFQHARHAYLHRARVRYRCDSSDHHRQHASAHRRASGDALRFVDEVVGGTPIEHSRSYAPSYLVDTVAAVRAQ